MSEEKSTRDNFANRQEDRKQVSESGGLREEGFLKLPYDWSVSTVNEAAAENGLVDGDWIESDDMDEDGEIQLVQLAHIGEGRFKGEPDRFITEEFADEENCTILSEGDLLISRMQEPILRSCLLPPFERDSVMAVDIARLEHTDDWNRNFLKYLFNSRPIWKQGVAWASGTTRKRISRTNMEKLRLPAPPIKEQSKIVSVFFTVDQAIQKTEEIVQQTERVKKGVMQNLYNKGIGHNDFIDTDFGQMPDSWELKKIEEVCEIGGGGTPSKSDPNYWEGDILWTTPKDFDSPRMTQTEDQLTEDGAEEATSDIYQPGSTMLVVRSGILRRKLPVAKIITPTTVNQDLKVLQPTSGSIDPDYLFQILYSLSERIRGRCKKTGTTVESIETNMLKKYRLKIPPINEQKRIAEIGETFDDKIQSSKENLDQLLRLKQGLMQDLVSGEVRTHDKDIEVLDEVRQHG